MRRQASIDTRSQRGAALLIFALILISTLLGTFLSRLNTAAQATQRDQITTDTLAQAKEALIGFAASYRDTHPDEVFGYLPCPDTDNDGISDSCGATDVSLIGRLPWKTLGLPPLRDGAAECLWYAVSGSAKDSPKTAALNWDTPGQFIVQDAGGTILAGASAHEQPLALILAPRAPLGAQSRTSAGTTECGGSNSAADYFEVLDILGTATPPAAKANSTIVLANAESIRAGTNNDRGLWITSKEIFSRVKKRSDFKTDVDSLLNDFSLCLNAIVPAGLPAAAAANKGIDNIVSTCPMATTGKANTLKNWKDNLLYMKPASNATLNGVSDCAAVLFFGGERTTRTVAPLNAQTRGKVAERGDSGPPAYYGEPTMYLENANATLFPLSGIYTSEAFFSSAAASSDLARCIKGLPAGATQQSFAADFTSFTKAGPGSGAAVSTDSTNKTVTITDASGTGNGCLWLSTIIPLAGKTLRSYYEFQFSYPDTFALSGGSDRGNGFTFQMVRGDIPDAFGNPSAPNLCGTETNMGALVGAITASDFWGRYSFIVETDVHKNTSRSDPAGNHTAIMLNGNLNHALSGGTPGAACDGSSNGCLHSPANKFEESPTPLTHNQRIEVHTGCDATCASCTPANHVTPNTYVKFSAWVDCVDCNDVITDYVGSELIAATENRDFSALGNWSGSNWAVAADIFSHVAGANPATLPNSALRTAPVAASTYDISASVATSAPGTLNISFGGTSSGPITLAAGNTTFRVQLKAVSAATLTVTPDASWVGSIDNVSITPWKTPTIQRCVDLATPVSDPNALNSVFVGFTGGFSSSASTTQGVTLRNFTLRSD